MRVLLFIFTAGILLAQNDVLRLGPGIKPPQVLHKVEPEFSDQARAEHVQGTVLLEIVVDTDGRATNISVLSPLGFGLDERAIASVEKWRFQPAEKDGHPVRLLATIFVNFRFQGIRFDEKSESRRASYNMALHNLKKTDDKSKTHAVETIRKLSQEGFAPAMYLESMLLSEGRWVPANPQQAFVLLKMAAEKNFGPAMYEIGRKYLEGTELPKDIEKGLDMMRGAAVLGSLQAQSTLGSMYQKGEGVPADGERARRYFRLCAAANDKLCQLRLGQMLIEQPERKERDYVQGIAWLELASEQGAKNADAILDKERPNLTTAQVEWAEKLKSQLVHQP